MFGGHPIDENGNLGAVHRADEMQERQVAVKALLASE